MNREEDGIPTIDIRTHKFSLIILIIFSNRTTHQGALVNNLFQFLIAMTNIKL